MHLLAIALSFSIGIWLATAASAQTPAKTEKVDIVAVTGCLRENPANTWTLVNATDPVASIANAPSAKEIASAPRVNSRRSGSNT